MIRSKGFALNKVFLALLIPIFTLGTGVLTQIYPSSLHYLVFIEATSTTPNYPDSFSLTIHLKTTVASSTLRVEEIDALVVNSPSRYIVNYVDFASRVLSAFFGKVQAYSRDLDGERTYWGIDSYVVEAKAVRLSNGVEYREASTGLYLGGRYRETYGVTLYRVFRYVTISYEFNVFVLLRRVEPQAFINRLDVVDIPVGIIKRLLFLFATAVVLASIYVLMNWRKYRIV